MSRSHIC